MPKILLKYLFQMSLCISFAVKLSFELLQMCTHAEIEFKLQMSCADDNVCQSIVLANAFVCLFRQANKLYCDHINICRDPRLRPSFAEIMTALKPLQKPINSPQVPRSSSSRVQPPRIAEGPPN